jgi:mono/diheme cytochrome c family protein
VSKRKQTTPAVKYFFLGVFTTILAIGILGFLYLWLGWAEVRGDVPVSQSEAYLKEMAVHAAIRRNVPELKSPVPPTDVNLITGGKMYLDQCAGCHGTPGKQRKYPDGLNPPVPQLPTVGTHYSESQVYWLAKHGIRGTGMVPNGEQDSDEELWAIAAYVKRMSSLPPRVQEELAQAVSKPE